MRNRITALALAAALGVSAAQAQPRDDADATEPVNKFETPATNIY